MKLVMKFLALLILPRWDRNSSQPYRVQLVRRIKSLSSCVLGTTFKLVSKLGKLGVYDDVHANLT